jgi:hypothetical protein
VCPKPPLDSLDDELFELTLELVVWISVLEDELLVFNAVLDVDLDDFDDAELELNDEDADEDIDEADEPEDTLEELADEDFELPDDVLLEDEELECDWLEDVDSVADEELDDDIVIVSDEDVDGDDNDDPELWDEVVLLENEVLSHWVERLLEDEMLEIFSLIFCKPLVFLEVNHLAFWDIPLWFHFRYHHPAFEDSSQIQHLKG